MGQFHVIRELHSPAEGFGRTVRIFLPELPGRPPGTRLGVLYAQDGQNVFARCTERPSTWAADIAVEALVAQEAIAPWMVVAVDHGLGRLEEYSLWDEPRFGAEGRAERYLDFLVETLKPFIDEQFPTLTSREHTAVMGSSMGGLLALAAAYRRPQTFGRVLALSPSVMWADHAIFRDWAQRTREPLRLYLDAGAHEGFMFEDLFMDYGGSVSAFHEHLARLGYGPEELKLVLEPMGQHSEADWRRRLPAALRWAL